MMSCTRSASLFQTLQPNRSAGLQDAAGCRGLAECIRDGYIPSRGTGTHAAAAYLQDVVAQQQSPALQASAVDFVAREAAAIDGQDSLTIEDGVAPGGSEHGPAASTLTQLLQQLETLACTHVDGKQDASVPLRLHEALLRQGAVSRAQQCLEEGLKRMPDSWQLWAALLRLRAAQSAAGNCDTAISASRTPESAQQPGLPATGHSTAVDGSMPARQGDIAAVAHAALRSVDSAGAVRLLAPCAAALQAAGQPLDLVVHKAVQLLQNGAGTHAGDTLADTLASVLLATWCVRLDCISKSCACKLCVCASASAVAESMVGR